mmetsp:Transcript_23750/g.73119  ORF Transcript_23750/g.73119 Transcript_23750/m.73119 type:complete len:174 (+) Transcript_23750:2-523(+)
MNSENDATSMLALSARVLCYRLSLTGHAVTLGAASVVTFAESQGLVAFDVEDARSRCLVATGICAAAAGLVAPATPPREATYVLWATSAAAAIGLPWWPATVALCFRLRCRLQGRGRRRHRPRARLAAVRRRRDRLGAVPARPRHRQGLRAPRHGRASRQRRERPCLRDLPQE